MVVVTFYLSHKAHESSRKWTLQSQMERRWHKPRAPADHSVFPRAAKHLLTITTVLYHGNQSPTPPTPISSLRLARWQTAFPQINPRLHCCSIHHNPTEDPICSCLSVSLSPHTSSSVSLHCFSLQLLFDSFAPSRFLFLPLSHLWCNSSVVVFFLCLWTPS